MEKQIMIQFSAGQGPVECAFVVAKVLAIFLKEASKHGIATQVMQTETGSQNRTMESATILLTGADLNLNTFKKKWLGTIQWIGQSTFRKLQKRKNWFIGCFELPTNQLPSFNERDVVYQAMRSSGAGGQHVNKVSSAIRARHLPTDIQVVVMDTKSQHQNRKIALKRIEEKVISAQFEQLKSSKLKEWKNHKQLERGNPTRVFQGGDFKPQKVKQKFKHSRSKQKNEWRKKMNE